ncbi:MAG: hypothetical protein WDM77_14795 [Steroidobacteraceae bacterium]
MNWRIRPTVLAAAAVIGFFVLALATQAMAAVPPVAEPQPGGAGAYSTHSYPRSVR